MPTSAPTETITAETTVGEIVRAAPNRSRLLEQLGIDYCCGGKKTLAEACQRKGLDGATVAALLSALDATSSEAGEPLPNPDELSLSALCDHIERSHHAYLREELPQLDYMARKVAARHGEHEPRLVELRDHFRSFALAMAAHTEEEEREIFPAIRRLESDGDEATAATLSAGLEKLESEHEGAGAALERFHALTDDFSPPEWACNTFRTLFDRLKSLDRETHQHVHKENNILFPRTRTLLTMKTSVPSTKTPQVEAVLDVRPLAGRIKHATIFQWWFDLPVGGHFVLLNDHDPVPLRYQFDAEYSGAFSWEYLERGPEAFRVKIGKLRAVNGVAPQPPVLRVVAAAPAPTAGGVPEVDARGLEPPEPLVRILAALESLPAGATLRARTDREPCHLFGEAEQRGFSHQCNQQPDGSWITVLAHA